MFDICPAHFGSRTGEDLRTARHDTVSRFSSSTRLRLLIATAQACLSPEFAMIYGDRGTRI